MGDTNPSEMWPVPSRPNHVSSGRNVGVAQEVAKSHRCPAVGSTWKIWGLGEALRSHHPNGRVGDNDLQGSCGLAREAESGSPPLVRASPVPKTAVTLGDTCAPTCCTHLGKPIDLHFPFVTLDLPMVGAAQDQGRMRKV